MHPAASVIAFTTLSGAGYGLWVWLAVAALTADPPPALVLVGLLTGAALVTAGLLSSTLHLRRPERAWRALTQWRSSWLSREAIAALATYVPLAAWLWALRSGHAAAALPALGLAAGSLVTVFCTGKIYASLKAIARWHHPLVVPLYVAFALVSGGGLFAALWHAIDPPPIWLLPTLAALCAATWLVKMAYWRGSDARPVAGSVNTATGLSGTVRVFDPPHTEANYLLNEMGYVVARRRARALRRLSLALGLALAPAALLIGAAAPGGAVVLTGLAAAATLLAVAVERWLFFAQARHSVGHYYGLGQRGAGAAI